MAENNKKRCRKDKLVIRDFKYLAEEKNSDMQEKAQINMSNIKTEMHNDDQSNSPVPPPIEFSINVEVEEYSEGMCVKNEYDSDNDMVIDEIDYTLENYIKQNCENDPKLHHDTQEVTNFAHIEPGTSLLKKHLNVIDSSETITESTEKVNESTDKTNKTTAYREIRICKKESILKPVTMASKFYSPAIKMTININEKEVFLAAEKILQTTKNFVDKLLAVEVKNVFGRIIRPKLEETALDLMIDEVVNKWRRWTICSKYRDLPLFYKCYICNKSWWCLYPFQLHIRSHDITTLLLSLEEFSHECNIIAFENTLCTLPEKKDIYTEGNCLRCNKSFITHRSVKLNKGYYSCELCQTQFYSCNALRKHESGCRRSEERRTSMKIRLYYPCDLCSFSFPLETELNRHMEETHTVRSDLPTTAVHKPCNICGIKYCSFTLHNCPKKALNFNCNYCNRVFGTRQLVALHNSCTPDNFECKICNVILAKQCMAPDHYLQHTDTFKLILKCSLCKDSFGYLNEQLMRQHITKNHKYDKRKKQYETVLVPKICLESKPDQLNVVSEIQENESSTINPESKPGIDTTILKSELAPAINEMNQISDVASKPTDLATAKKISDELETVPQELPSAVVEIKKEIVDTDEEIEPRFYVAENDNMDYEEVLSNILQVSQNTETKIKTEIKSEPEEDYDDIIQLAICGFNGVIHEDEQTRADEQTKADEQTLDSVASSKDTSCVKLKPEDAPKSIYKKPKVYSCTKCGYKNYHKEFHLHMQSHCQASELPSTPRVYRYKCTKCPKSYTTIKKYIQHFEYHGYRYLSCPKCTKVHDTMTKLIAHLNGHIKQSYIRINSIEIDCDPEKSKNFYQCKVCKEKVYVGDFFKHWECHLVINVVKVEAMSDDEACHGDDVNSDRALETHVLRKAIARLKDNNTKKDADRACSVCGRVFVRRNDCKRHLIEHLLTDAFAHKPKNEGLKCQICQEIHTTAERYKRHMRDHGSLPIYKCELCDRTFSDSSNFTKHKKVHNLQVLICDICKKKFQARISLEKHIEMHEITEPIKCTLCPKIFYTQSACKKHWRLFHQKNGKSFGCYVCGMKFACLKEKWEHMWLKHKERKQKADCPVCGKKFRKLQDVKAHVRDDHNVKVRNMKIVSDDKQSEDIEEFLKNSSSLELGEEETLIVYE